jgi:putative transposase
MLSFKSVNGARAILSGFEMLHMVPKQLAKYARNLHPSLANQFKILVA